MEAPKSSCRCIRLTINNNAEFLPYAVFFCMITIIQEFTAPSLNVAQAGNKGATGGQLEIDYEFSDQHQWLNR